MVPGVRVFGIRSLGQVVALLKGDDQVPEAPEVEPMSGSPLLSWRGEERLEDLDMADVIGMQDARYALEVAAAGGHHLMLTGPKGSGKTTLAERIPGLLPDLDRRRVPGAHRGALPVGGAAGGRLATRPAAVPSAAPLGLARGHPRRRERTGATGRGEQGPSRGAVPRRVPVVPQRRRGGLAGAAGGRGDLDLAR